MRYAANGANVDCSLMEIMSEQQECPADIKNEVVPTEVVCPAALCA